MAMQEFTPLQYLQLDIASNYGLDREDWDVRLDWFQNHEEELKEIAREPEKASKHPLMQEADSPALFFAGIMAWAKATRGEAIGYPISLDATASGAQLLAILIGCEKSARKCNLIDTGHREDFYESITELMKQELQSQGSDLNVTRQQSKDAIMPSFYGSTRAPKRVFGEEGEQIDAYLKTMQEEATGIWDLNEAFLDIWQPQNHVNEWILPDNFHVRVKVMDKVEESFEFLGEKYMVESYVNRPTPNGLSLGANTIHSLDGLVVREMSRRCSYNPEKMETLLKLLARPVVTQIVGEVSPNAELVMTLWSHYEETGFLSARILELLDETNIHLVDRDVISKLVQTLPDAPFQVLSVHDCFRCLPNYGNDLRRQYNQILHELAKSDILASIVSQIKGEKTAVFRYGDFANDILQANYALS